MKPQSNYAEINIKSPNYAEASYSDKVELLTTEIPQRELSYFD